MSTQVIYTENTVLGPGLGIDPFNKVPTNGKVQWKFIDVSSEEGRKLEAKMADEKKQGMYLEDALRLSLKT